MVTSGPTYRLISLIDWNALKSFQHLWTSWNFADMGNMSANIDMPTLLNGLFLKPYSTYCNLSTAIPDSRIKLTNVEVLLIPC